LHNFGTVFVVDGSGTINTKVNFSNDILLTTADRGRSPVAGLVSDGLGFLWGTTQYGGVGGNGTVFKINVSTGAIDTKVDFVLTNTLTIPERGAEPLTALVSDGLGYLWGTTSASGGMNGGTVFKVEASSGTISNQGDFANSLIGTARGGAPCNALMNDGAGNFWGMTAHGGRITVGGTVYKVAIATGGINTVADMGTNPVRPYAGLASDSAGNLWGTTNTGGATGFGTLFKLDTSLGTMTTMMDFFPISGTNDRGGIPISALVSDGAGNLWGTTSESGAYNGGTVFAVNPSTGIINTLDDFGSSSTGTNRGAGPSGPMMSDGAGPGGSAVNFWGTTYLGGLASAGTVFVVDASTGYISTVAEFANSADLMVGNRGSGPQGGLVSDGTGYYWGTTSSGGATNNGTVFKIQASSGTISTLVDFEYSTDTGKEDRGGKPQAGLVSDGAGYLWGTTYEGGKNSVGTVFKVDLSGTIHTVVDFSLYDPADDRGAGPESALVSDGAGNLWGVTTYGGAYGYGTVFKINTSSGAITTLIDLTGLTGDAPGGTTYADYSYGPLVPTASGAYGTTSGGGDGGGGEIFFINQGPQFGLSVGSITSSGGTVSGDANPRGMATDVQIQYGTTTSYGSTTSTTSLGSGTSAAPFSIALSGLSAGTAYHYRLVFITAFGKFYSADQTFTTAN
jgi:uncharacterized repeat protein (TIGR03803 family)